MSTCTNIDQGLACTEHRPNHRYCSAFDEKLWAYREWTNPLYDPPKAVEGGQKKAQGALEGMAARVKADPTSDGAEPAESPSGHWTEAQQALVWTTIEELCREHAGGGEFTVNDIWARLAGRVPVRNGGMAVMLDRGRRRWLMDETGKSRTVELNGVSRTSPVWYSLAKKKVL